jgi:hypothetical protein
MIDQSTYMRTIDFYENSPIINFNTFSIHTKDFGLMVEINMHTGEITYGPNYNPDEAARVFWDAVGRNRP